MKTPPRASFFVLAALASLVALAEPGERWFQARFMGDNFDPADPPSLVLGTNEVCQVMTYKGGSASFVWPPSNHSRTEVLLQVGEFVVGPGTVRPNFSEQGQIVVLKAWTPAPALPVQVNLTLQVTNAPAAFARVTAD